MCLSRTDREGLKMQRPSWDEYFMEIAHLVAKRSSCLRRSVGAVLTKNKQILSTGYNGVPSGISHCNNNGCIRTKMGIPSGERHELCRGLHAEQNAIIQAAKHGYCIDGASLFITNQACIICTKAIIAAGVVRIVYENPYNDQLALEMLSETKIEIVHYQKKD